MTSQKTGKNKTQKRKGKQKSRPQKSVAVSILDDDSEADRGGG